MQDDLEQIVTDESVTSDMPETQEAEPDDSEDKDEAEQVENEEEATASEDDGEADDEDADAEKEDGDDAAAEKPKRKAGFQKRIDELTRKHRQAEREAEALRQRLQQLERLVQPQDDAQETDAPPKPEDFEDEAEYIVARAKYEARKEFEAQQKKAVENLRQQELQARQARFDARADLARAKYDDFDAVAKNPDVPINEAMAEVIMDSELGPDIAYYLGSNPDEAREIASLPPFAAAHRLGVIEARLSQQSASTATRKATKAPAPPKTVKGSRTSDRPDPEKISYEEYKRLRMAKKLR